MSKPTVAVQGAERREARDGPAYMPQLDGLRGLATITVITQHWKPVIYGFDMRWGAYGLHLFFVMSGYLITGILLRCRAHVEAGNETGLTALRQFYIRRFLRIFPIFYAVLGLAALLGDPYVRETWTWHASYLSNVYFALRGSFYGTVTHFWSLAVEEQFYCLWPLLILFAPARLVPRAIAAVILTGVVFRLGLAITHWHPLTAQWLTPACLDFLGWGALLAWMEGRGEDFAGGVEGLARRTLIVGVSSWIVLKTLAMTGPWQQAAAALANSAGAMVFVWLIFRASRGFSGPVGRLLTFAPLIFLGKISYCVYIVHNFMPAILRSLADMLGVAPPSGGLRLAVLFLMSVGFAALSWRFFESPINDLKRLFPYRVRQAV